MLFRSKKVLESGKVATVTGEVVDVSCYLQLGKRGEAHVPCGTKCITNGQPIGISHGAAFYPFELDATDAIQPGKNTIVVCVSNQVVNELGTGGIVAPVMLYAPVAGKEAKLENVRDLKPTFP